MWRSGDGVVGTRTASRGSRVAAEAFGATRGGGQGGAPGRCDVPGGKTNGGQQTDGEGSGAPISEKENKEEEEERGGRGGFAIS